MNDKPIIIAALALFVVVAAFPIWYTLGYAAYSGKDASPPDLELPQGQGQCVQDGEWMRANHMNLLKEWRRSVVREADDSQVEINGEMYDKSLTKGCMKCHSNRESFCYRCHVYAGIVRPSPLQESATAQRGLRCWNCHVDPKREVNDG